ncbi:MAG: molybdopterin oxidoreductase [Niastella sp.]|jgi:hypothetical protein|uniref:molybdopterin oxidoreductase n=1 Tax=Niastella sp. TaxID=1869183 RepID=UPI00389AE54E
MHIGHYIELVHKGHQDLAEALRKVALHHVVEPDIVANCTMLATWSDQLVLDLQPFVDYYGEEKDREPDRMKSILFVKPRTGGMGLLRDLHDLWLMSNEAELCCLVLKMAAMGLGDEALLSACNTMEKQTKRQTAWLLTRIKSAAPQTLIAAE